MSNLGRQGRRVGAKLGVGSSSSRRLPRVGVREAASIAAVAQGRGSTNCDRFSCKRWDRGARSAICRRVAPWPHGMHAKADSAMYGRDTVGLGFGLGVARVGVGLLLVVPT